jgi:hypothetical protein
MNKLRARASIQQAFAATCKGSERTPRRELVVPQSCQRLFSPQNVGAATLAVFRMPAAQCVSIAVQCSTLQQQQREDFQ